MATTTLPPLNPAREVLQISVLVGLAILLVTQDLRGLTPFLLLGLAFIIAMNGYRRTSRPPSESTRER